MIKPKNNNVFSGPLLNIFNQTSLPIAIYSAGDLVIHYANNAFIELWGIESLEGATALKLIESVGNAALIRALKSINQETARITLSQKFGSGPDFTFFESIIEKVDVEPGFIIQTMYDVTRLQAENEYLKIAVSTLETQNDAIYKELLTTGQELEESYITLEATGKRILGILELTSKEVELPGIGYWAVNLEDMSIEFSNEAKRIYGIPADATVSFDDILRVTGNQFITELEQLRSGDLDVSKLCHFEYKINPANGEPSKWLETSGAVVGKDNGRITRIAGIMMVI